MESAREGANWFLRLETGEELPGRLAEWARDEGIHAAAVLAGIGQIREGELGFLKDGRYDVARFAGPLELLTLSGSIAWEDGVPSLHLHATAGREDHVVVGGHLIRATVGLLAEISVRQFPGRTFRRPPIPGTELRALRLIDPPVP